MLVNQKSSYRQITEEDYYLMARSTWPTYQEFASGDCIEQSVANELDHHLNITIQKRQNISNFCVMPFYGWEYPKNTHCCLLPDNYNLSSIQTDILNNQRNPQCHKCWTLEDAGITSERQIKNYTLDHYANTDLLYLYDQCVAKENKTSHYQIAASNFCNATCVTCGDHASTAWADLLKKTSKNTIPLKLYKENTVQPHVDYAAARFIGFKGGESTMIRTHWDIIEQLIEHKNFDCCVSFVTNGGFTLTNRQQHLLSQFKNVNFNFSIDGVGSVFEYMRYPISWDKINKNINWARDQKFMVSSTYTISNLNIYYHAQTVKWFADNNIQYLENLVYGPVYFSPKSLSKPIKHKIMSGDNSELIQNLLRDHSDIDHYNYQECLKQIQFQDQLKNIRIQDYLPEFWALTQSA
jgi:MoaA/NifB/PqqE/SkfB family radical SAM enzyme